MHSLNGVPRNINGKTHGLPAEGPPIVVQPETSQKPHESLQFCLNHHPQAAEVHCAGAPKRRQRLGSSSTQRIEVVVVIEGSTVVVTTVVVATVVVVQKPQVFLHLKLHNVAKYPEVHLNEFLHFLLHLLVGHRSTQGQ
jgi:hypothetical protein